MDKVRDTFASFRASSLRLFPNVFRTHALRNMCGCMAPGADKLRNFLTESLPERMQCTAFVDWCRWRLKDEEHGGGGCDGGHNQREDFVLSDEGSILHDRDSDGDRQEDQDGQREEG